MTTAQPHNATANLSGDDYESSSDSWYGLMPGGCPDDSTPTLSSMINARNHGNAKRRLNTWPNPRTDGVDDTPDQGLPPALLREAIRTAMIIRSPKEHVANYRQYLAHMDQHFMKEQGQISRPPCVVRPGWVQVHFYEDFSGISRQHDPDIEGFVKLLPNGDLDTHTVMKMWGLDNCSFAYLDEDDSSESGEGTWKFTPSSRQQRFLSSTKVSQYTRPRMEHRGCNALDPDLMGPKQPYERPTPIFVLEMEPISALAEKRRVLRERYVDWLFMKSYVKKTVIDPPVQAFGDMKAQLQVAKNRVKQAAPQMSALEVKISVVFLVAASLALQNYRLYLLDKP